MDFYKKVVPLQPKGIIVISHGYGSHSGIYEHVVEAFNVKGYGVYIYDHRGHGQTKGTRGHVSSFEVFMDDLHQIINIIKNNHPDLPIYTLGHSMGGLIAFVYGIRHPEALKGQIFSAAALGRPWGTRLLPVWFFEFAKRYFPRLKIYNLFSRPVSRDATFMAQHKVDPLNLKYATAGLFAEFIHCGISYARQNSKFYSLPCLLLHGRADKIIPFQNSVDVYNEISSVDKSIKLYENLYHELLQEPEKQLVIADIIDWLDSR